MLQSSVTDGISKNDLMEIFDYDLNCSKTNDNWQFILKCHLIEIFLNKSSLSFVWKIARKIFYRPRKIVENRDGRNVTDGKKVLILSKIILTKISMVEFWVTIPNLGDV